MKYCSIDAFARCPLDERCKDFREASYMEGSECDAFNQEVLNRPRTNVDRIRDMNDEKLAKYLFDVEQGNFTIDCCDDRFCDTQNCCHDCTEAAVKWLRQPAEVN